jgi:hypothetical protein
MSASIATDNSSKSKPLSTSSPKSKVVKLLLREIEPGVLSEKGRAKVVLANGKSYSIDASRIKSISYIPGRGYIVDYETEHPEFYEEKKSIADPNDPVLKLAIPLKFRIEKSIETVYLCPLCGRELEAEEDADDIAYRCRVHGFEWKWDEYVSPLDRDEVELKRIEKQVKRTRLEIDPPNIADVENLVAKFADIEAKWINDIPKELEHILKQNDSSKYSADLYTSLSFRGAGINRIIMLAMKEINNEKYLLAEITKGIYEDIYVVKYEEIVVERALFKIRVRDQELFNLLFGKKEEAKQKIEIPAPAEAVKQQEKIEKKIEEPKEPEISFEEAVKIARSKIPDWADGIVFVRYEICRAYEDYSCYDEDKALPVKISRKPGSLFYTSARWRSIDLGEHSNKIFKHLTNKLVTKDEIYEIEPVDSSFERKEYYDLRLKNMEEILKKRKIENFDDLVSEIDRILPEWSIGVYVSKENDRHVVRMIAEYPSRDYDYYYKENWVVNLDVPEDLLKHLEGKVVLRSGKVVEVERAGKRPSDKIKLNKKG